jgi:predicted Zn-dependent protease
MRVFGRRAATWAELVLVGLLGAAGCGAAPVKAEFGAESVDSREQVIGAMQAELTRSMREMRHRDFEPPYFMAYALEHVEDVEVAGKYGSVVVNDSSVARTAYVEVRVGDYAFDNFANVDGESFRMSDYQPDRSAPLGSDEAAIRGTFWLLTDETYKKAISDYLTKRGSSVYDTDEKIETPSFSKEPVVKFRDEISPVVVDRADWERQVREVTAEMKSHPGILDSSMEVTARRSVRYFVNSEGSTVVEESRIYAIQLSAWTRADDGQLLDNGRSFYAREMSGLPDLATLKTHAHAMATELEALAKAPKLDPYTGPAILAPEASGVLFHEVIGHRLEGERQRDEEEGRTFKGRVGQAVLPEFLSVSDDPTLAQFGRHQLNGFYLYDEEGVRAQRVSLIERGVLRGFLKSRTPIEGSLESNGHGRAQGIRKPMARMANLVVEADPSKVVSEVELKAMLIAEVKRQGKPFGLIIRDITGGSTNTSGWGYQAFKGSPRLVYKVDPETGAETLVRGVELVGTPLTSINKIVAASNTSDVFNGYCGAESGYVPVSTVAPSLLTTEIELQRKPEESQRAPILSAPWN